MNGGPLHRETHYGSLLGCNHCNEGQFLFEWLLVYQRFQENSESPLKEPNQPEFYRFPLGHNAPDSIT